jgi:hypothetical protein
MALNNVCDMVGGVCYEAMPEKLVLAVVVAISVLVHVVVIAVGVALDRRRYVHGG